VPSTWFLCIGATINVVVFAVWHAKPGIYMNAVLSPIVSEFETEEEAKNYDLWFRAKVQESLDDPRPSLPHDEAMARVEKLLNEKRASRAAR
jgi:hypothetical protein